MKIGMTRTGREGRSDSGETLAFLVIWPTLIVAILLLLVHTFIVVNAQAEAEVAASAGLRAAWREAAAGDFYTSDDTATIAASDMAAAAKDAAAEVAGQEQGWRWWTPNATEVKSDWCWGGTNVVRRPDLRESGWVQVKVEGEVFGPMAALWPGRLDRVYAVATGPAILSESLELQLQGGGYALPAQGSLEVC